MKTKVLALSICALFIISGCGNSSITPPLSPISPNSNMTTTTTTTTTASSPAINQVDSPAGYLVIGISNVFFVRWTEVDKKLTGQLQVFEINGTEGNQQGNSSTHSFTGVLDKENISLNFTGSVWVDGLGGQTWTGTLKKNILTLVIPNSDGKLSTVSLQPSTVEEYNNAVTNLQIKMTDTKNRIQDQKNQQAQAKAKADELSRQQYAVASSNRNLFNNINYIPATLKQHTDIASNFDVLLGNYNTHYSILQDKYTNIKTNASVTPLTDPMIGSIQSQLGSMESVLGAIESDGGAMESRQGSVDSYISQLNDLKASILSNWNSLQSAVSQNSTGIPKADFTADDVRSAISSIASEIDRVNSVSKEKHKQADDIYRNAKNMLSEASKFVQGLKVTNSF
jgi:hypothetical protein